jgi:hypothetical protein
VFTPVFVCGVANFQNHMINFLIAIASLLLKSFIEKYGEILAEKVKESFF